MSSTSFPLETLGLKKETVAACQRNNLHNAADILLAPTHDLTKKLKWRVEAVHALVRDVSRAIAPRTSSVGALMPDKKQGEASGRGRASQAVPHTQNRARSRSRSAGYGLQPSQASQANRGQAGEADGGRLSGVTPAPSIGRNRLGRAGGGGYADGDWIRTGDETWDKLLGGGVRLGSIVEISGESAAGKSHFALSLSIAAQLPNLSTLPGGTIILSSERQISTDRLKDIARNMLDQHGSSDFRTPSRLMQSVMTTKVKDVDELDLALGYWIPALLQKSRVKQEGLIQKMIDAHCDAEDPESTKHNQRTRLFGHPGTDEVKREYEASRQIVNADRNAPASLSTLATSENTYNRNGAARLNSKASRDPPNLPIRLLVLDSITALLRGAETSYSTSSAGLTARSRSLCLVADKLKALAVEHNLAVIVINQVSDVIDRSSFVNTRPPADDEDDDLSVSANNGANGMKASQYPGSSQHLAHSQAASPGIKHSEAWATTGPAAPMLYSTQSKWFSGQASAKTKEAALGIVWANAVNVRIMMSRTGRRRVIDAAEVPKGAARGTKRSLEAGVRALGDESGVDMARFRTGINTRQHADQNISRLVWTDGEDEEEEERILIRRAHCVFSPFAPSSTVDFVITTSGVHAVSGSYKVEDTGADVLKRQKRRRAMLEVGNVGDEPDHASEGDGEGEEMYDNVDGLDGIPDEWWNGDVMNHVSGIAHGSGQGVLGGTVSGEGGFAGLV